MLEDRRKIGSHFRECDRVTRRRIPTLPIETLMDHPVAMTLPAAAFGMLARLALHFHATECRPLPIADHELMHVARAHAPTWRRWKARVLETFEAIRPEIEGYRTHSLARRQGLIVASNLADRKSVV